MLVPWLGVRLGLGISATLGVRLRVSVRVWVGLTGCVWVRFSVRFSGRTTVSVMYNVWLCVRE